MSFNKGPDRTGQAGPGELPDRLARQIEQQLKLNDKPLFDALLPLVTDNSLAQEMLGAFRQRLADDPLFTPPCGVHMDASLCSLELYGKNQVHFSLAMLEPEQPAHLHEPGRRSNMISATSDGQDPVISFADGWSAIYLLPISEINPGRASLYHCDADHEHLRPGDACCRHVRSFDLQHGMLLVLENRREALHFDHIGQTLLMQRLLVRDPLQNYALECNARTGELHRIRQGRDDHGRFQLIMSMLRATGRKDAVPVIAQMMDEFTPHLRWQALREILALDSRAGVLLLAERAQGDADAGLRKLAASTLEMLLEQHPALRQLLEDTPVQTGEPGKIMAV